MVVLQQQELLALHCLRQPSPWGPHYLRASCTGLP